MSHDGENDADVLAGTAASAALAISDIPFEGPTATVRVARIHTDNGPQFVVNPTVSQLDYSDMDIVVAGHCDGLNMIEVGAAEIPDAVVHAGLEFGYGEINKVLALISEFSKKAAKPKVAGELHLPAPEITAKIAQLCDADLTKARQIKGKKERNDAVDAIRTKVLDQHFALNSKIGRAHV